jgi:zinc protease
LPFAFVEGGLGRLDIQELEQTEPGHFAGVALGVHEDYYELIGGTVEADVLLQLQILAAFFTDPGYRSDGLKRLLAAGPDQLKQMSGSPMGVLSRELQPILRDGDSRWVFPTAEQMRSLTMDDVRNAMGRSLASAPIEITIVGQVKVAAAIDAVAKTFGAFPPRADAFSFSDGARQVRFPPAGKSIALHHEGRNDQAAAAAAWPGPDLFSNTRQNWTIALLSKIVEMRLIEEVRETQGGTYVPFGDTWSSRILKGYGYILAGVEPRPEAVDAFFATLDQIERELRGGEISADLLERARKPMLYQLYAAESNNDYWLTELSGIQLEPRNLALLRAALQDVESITKDEVVAAARRYLDLRRRIDIRVVPRR